MREQQPSAVFPFGLKQAIEYYDSNHLQGPQAMKIDGLPPEVLGLTRNERGEIVLYLDGRRDSWRVASSGEPLPISQADMVMIDERGPQLVVKNRGGRLT